MTCSVWGRVLISSPFLLISTQIMASHGCTVMWLASQSKVNQLLPVSQEKHDTLCLTFRSYSWLLDGGNYGCPRSVSHYNGPHIGHQILLWVFLSLFKDISSTAPMGLKILTCWMLIYIMIYFTLHCEDLSTI